MQLFGLVNTMLANDRATAERDLSIARYAVIPLSPNSGLIGWVPNTDTLHALIREYRDARKARSLLRFSCLSNLTNTVSLHRLGAQHRHPASVQPQVP
jgi:phosphatidylinositol kinase/protein kinase (PI-3  family)